MKSFGHALDEPTGSEVPSFVNHSLTGPESEHITTLWKLCKALGDEWMTEDQWRAPEQRWLPEAEELHQAGDRKAKAKNNRMNRLRLGVKMVEKLLSATHQSQPCMRQLGIEHLSNDLAPSRSSEQSPTGSGASFERDIGLFAAALPADGQLAFHVDATFSSKCEPERGVDPAPTEPSTLESIDCTQGEE